MTIDATLKEFKVGDKVCDPVRFGNGVVTHIYESGHGRLNNNLLVVTFTVGNTWSYSVQGFNSLSDTLPSLYHGHMEEGTGKITFEPKKEPVYEWQWEYVSTLFPKSPRISVTDFYKTEKDMLRAAGTPNRKDFIRIERSKRLVIN
jgi:hypothetical protein